MSFTDAKEFQQSDVKFPATMAACSHRLTAHSVMVDLMMGETAPFLSQLSASSVTNS